MKYIVVVDVWSVVCVMVEIFVCSVIFFGDGIEFNQFEKIYNVFGILNCCDWFGLVDMVWFEFLRFSVKKKSVFVEKYVDKVIFVVFDLFEVMFLYDLVKRLMVVQVLQYVYFIVEELFLKQVVE